MLFRSSHTACTQRSAAQRQLGRPLAQVSISHTSGCHLLAVEAEARGKHGRSAGAVAVAGESAQGWPSVVPWGPADSRAALWSLVTFRFLVVPVIDTYRKAPS